MALKICDLQARISRLSATQESRKRNRLPLLHLTIALQEREAARDAEVARLCQEYARTCTTRGSVIVRRIIYQPFNPLHDELEFLSLAPPVEERYVFCPSRTTEQAVARLRRDLTGLARWAIEGKY